MALNEAEREALWQAHTKPGPHFDRILAVVEAIKAEADSAGYEGGPQAANSPGLKEAIVEAERPYDQAPCAHCGTEWVRCNLYDDPCCESCSSSGGCAHQEPRHICDKARRYLAERDQARRERDFERAAWMSASERCGDAIAERDEARRERDECLGASDA